MTPCAVASSVAPRQHSRRFADGSEHVVGWLPIVSQLCLKNGDFSDKKTSFPRQKAVAQHPNAEKCSQNCVEATFHKASRSCHKDRNNSIKDSFLVPYSRNSLKLKKETPSGGLFLFCQVKDNAITALRKRQNKPIDATSSDHGRQISANIARRQSKSVCSPMTEYRRCNVRFTRGIALGEN